MKQIIEFLKHIWKNNPIQIIVIIAMYLAIIKWSIIDGIFPLDICIATIILNIVWFVLYITDYIRKGRYIKRVSVNSRIMIEDRYKYNELIRKLDEHNIYFTHYNPKLTITIIDSISDVDTVLKKLNRRR